MMANKSSPSEIIQKAFPGVSQKEAGEMAISGEVHSYPADTVLCEEGALERVFYIILEGEVQVTKVINQAEVRILKILGPGDFFGEMALIHNAPRAASVTTLVATTVLEINKHIFDQMLHRNASVSLAMVREVSRRLRENDEMAIEDLRVKSQELALAYQQLAEQDYAQHEFLSSIAHELRTPLTASYGYVQAIRMGMIHGQAFTSTLDTIEKNLQKIITLVNDILFLQEMELILLDFEPVDLGTIARAAVGRFRERARKSGMRIHLSIAPELPLVSADARAMDRVLSILLDNAIKFSPNGGDLRVEVDFDESDVWLKVIDSGVGIPREAMPRLFRRFFRLDEVDGHLFSGTGMGLSIARQVVEQHHGMILVESEPGKGSTFTVKLQRQDASG
jgi:signal transduction histidine kinase